jgi:hypothetical protein
MNLRRIIPSLVVGTVLISTASDVQAQSRRPSGVASLGEMRCQRTQGSGGYKAINEDIPIGREIFRAIAYIGQRPYFLGTGDYGIWTTEASEVVCRLAAPNETPRFRTLTLAFGFAADSSRRDYIEIDGSVNVLVSIYKDNNFYASQNVSRGEKIRFPIDIANTRSLSIEAQCIRPASGSKTCPVLYFFEDTLRK